MTQNVECNECGASHPKSKMYEIEVWARPFDVVSHTIYVCKETPAEFKIKYGMKWLESCSELLTDSSWADFRYFTCGECGRMICEQNPSNGWHVQYRWVDEEQICLKCYEERLITKGSTKEEFENGIPGMFLDDNTLREAGFRMHSSIDDMRVSTLADVARVCEVALDLIDHNYKVLINYERMAIGGLEGHVTLWYADKETENDKPS